METIYKKSLIATEVEDCFFEVSIVNKETLNVVSETYGDTPEEAHRNADIIIDALNTHNTTGYTPSQLLEQKRELVEALRYFTDRVEAGTIRSQKTYTYYKELLTKHSKDV